ncbi:hypothetical protein NIES267_56200 [Calothrix parasitica NIES-267]|uniref:Uncharacterized protein n=1 Tax=Calothrix parasitica NIES-267 TaxID=1973488 RepID=A0A1Z4LY02_9CYAN|nr:hypothetical protein NIES267_56200 [Calothrix parasitica NIES-267]
MRIETDKEFWVRQLEEWREIVRQRKLKKIYSGNNPLFDNNATNKPV